MSKELERFIEHLTESDNFYIQQNINVAKLFVSHCLSLVEQAIEENPQHSRVFKIPWSYFRVEDYWDMSHDSKFSCNVSADRKLMLARRMWARGSQNNIVRVRLEPYNEEFFNLCLRSYSDPFDD